MVSKHLQVIYAISLLLLIVFLGLVDSEVIKANSFETHGENFLLPDQELVSTVQQNGTYSFACNQFVSTELAPEGFTSFGNPSVKYCTSLGHQYTTITNPDGSQDGICTFSNKSTCDAWAFLQGKCGQSHNACAQQGLGTRTLNDGKNALTREYAVCINQEGQQVTSASDLIQLYSDPVIDLAPGNSNQADDTSQDFDTQPGSETLVENVTSVPSSFDWREYHGSDWVTPVKNQGSCGSCWAFSAVGAVEAVHNINSDDPDLDLDLSEEYLVSDCYSYMGYQACCGGWPSYALYHIRDSGIPTEACMPYVDGSGCTCTSSGCSKDCTFHRDDECSNASCNDNYRCVDWNNNLTKITSYGAVYPDRGSIQQALVKYGPLSVGFGYGSSFGGYWDGDIYRCSSDTGLNHGVVLVGYNNSDKYWIIKNSWGSTWNTDGYMKIGYGECLIEEYPYYVDSCSTLDTIENPSGAGTIAIEPSPNCGDGQYEPGTLVEITASPADDFSHWSGGVSGSSNPITLTLYGDNTVVANFVSAAYWDVKINEVYPGTPDQIELYNQGSVAVNLIGLEIQDSEGSPYTFPNFTLDPGAYVVIHEYGSSSSNTSTDLYTESNLEWVPGEGSAAFIDPITGVGLDFVRWGSSMTLPPSGMSWTGTNPDGPLYDLDIGRDESSTDTDDGSDWCTQSPTLGTVNGGCGDCFTPGQPELRAPSSGATTINNQPTFRWDLTHASNEYQIEIADNPSFSNTLGGITSGLEFTPGTTLGDSVYYWRVKGKYTLDGCTDDGTWSSTRTITINSSTEPQPILLVDDDDNDIDVLGYYTEPLDALGETYDLWLTSGTDNEPETAVLSQYGTVIWFSGYSSDKAGPGSAGESVLGPWLDSGKCMLISSQDYIKHHDTNTPFMSSYLGLGSFDEDAKQTTVTGGNGLFSGLGPYVLGYTAENTSDSITPDGTAELAFSGNQGDAGIYKDSGVFRTTYWGFPLAAVPKLSDRQDLLGSFLYWCSNGLPPIIKVDSTAMTNLQGPDYQVTKTLTISNTGTVDLVWGIGEEVTTSSAQVAVDDIPVPTGNTLSKGSNVTLFKQPIQKVKPGSTPDVGFTLLEPPFVQQSQDSAMLTLLNDGSFENGPPPASNWTENTPNLCERIGDWSGEFGLSAYDGIYDFWAGGYCDELPYTNYVSQTVTVPSTNTTLSFWFMTYRTDADDPTPDDYGYVAVNGSIVALLPLTQATNTYPNWVNANLNLNVYAGTTIDLKFGAVSIGELTGNMRFDFIEWPSQPACSNLEDIPWANVTPNGGTISPGNDSPVEVAFDSTGLGAGAYNGNLCIYSNDPYTPLEVVQLSLQVVTASGDILLVDDDDNTPDVIAVYTQTLDSLGKEYDIWDTGVSDVEPDVNYLSMYDKVIWFTGDSWSGTTGPGSSGESALSTWLDMGQKCMLISSQDYLYNRGITPFMDSYLGVLSATDDVTQTIVTGVGSIFSGVGPLTFDYSEFEWNYSDRISPDPAAELAFNGDEGDSAVNFDSGIFRTTYWGFPFETIESASDRQDAMTFFLNWCDSGYWVFMPLILK